MACTNAPNPAKAKGSSNPNDWVNCDTGTQGSPIAADKIPGTGGCVVAPKQTTNGVPASDWYVSLDEPFYSAAPGCNEGDPAACSKLQAVMIGLVKACKTNPTICYNEIGLNSKSLYTFKDSEAPDTGSVSPLPTGVNEGAILAYFYLAFEKASQYPPPAAIPCEKGTPNCDTGINYMNDCAKGKITSPAKWTANGPVANDACSYNGQCDTMGRWYTHEIVSEQTVPLVELDLSKNNGTKNPSSAFTLICASTTEAKTATEGPCFDAVKACQGGAFPFPPPPAA
jgi:hypothetical protein